jgi:hypothetical protein
MADLIEGASLSPITLLLAERAFSLGQQGKLAEAVAPLFVSAQLGGDARTAEIAGVVAWTLAEQADAALAMGKPQDAAALAGLGHAAAPNVRCLLILCVLYSGRDQATAAYFARQLITTAEGAPGANHWAALKYVIDRTMHPSTPETGAAIIVHALEQYLTAMALADPSCVERQSTQAMLDDALRARPMPDIAVAAPGSPALQRDLHQREAEYHALMGQPELSLAHCAAVQRLCTTDPDALTREAAEIDRLMNKIPWEALAESQEATEINQAMRAILGRSVATLAELMRRLFEKGETDALQSVARLAEALPVTETEQWTEVQYFCALANGWEPEEPIAARDARACDAMIAAIDQVLAESPSTAVRFYRCLFLLERGHIDPGLADLAVLVTQNLQRPIYGALSKALRHCWESADIPHLQTAAALARSAPAQEHLEWISVLYFCEIADRWTLKGDHDAIKRAAADAVMLRTDAMLQESDSPFEFRLQRTNFFVENDLFKYALDDLFVLFSALKSNPEWEKLYGSSVSRLILNLRVPSRFPEVDRIIRYLLEDVHFDPKFLLPCYLFAVQAGRMDVAYQVAERMAQGQPEWALIPRLKDFMEVDKQTPAKILGRAPRGRHLIYANMVCWGKKFVEKMAWGSLSSLLADRNFPLFCEDCDVVFDIVTHISDVPTICALPEIAELSKYCEIRLYCLPDIEDFSRCAASTQYFVFGHAQHFTVLRAQKDNVDVLLLASDVVYANGFLDFIRKNISVEPRGLFFDGLNCALTPVRAALQDHRDGVTLTIDAATLAEIAVRNFKPLALHCFFDKTEASTKSEMSMLYLRKPFGFRIYSLCQAPVYASAAALQGLTGFDCLAVEGKLSELLLNKLSSDQVITRRTTKDLLWIELDDNDRWELIPLGDKLVSHVDSVVRFFRFSARSQARFKLFDRFVDCQVASLTHGDFIDDETEARFIAEVNRRRVTDRVLTELCID